MTALLGFSPSAKPLLPQSSQASRQAFEQRIEHEFIVGSAIDSALFEAATGIVADVEVRPGGDVETPIHDALNWRYTRFGNQARSTLYAVLLLQETGVCWQAKLSKTRSDSKGKSQKYETPKDNGARAFLSTIPAEIRQRISDRYGVEVPLTGSFWNWLEQHPEIPIVFTEGGKKALSLLSLGYVAIALYGVNGGYSNVTGIRSLTPDVARFAVGDRQIALAFDQDADSKTRKRVNVAIVRFGGLLEQAGAKVSIAQWHGRDGKGVDDLIATCGADAFISAYNAALRLNHWQLWQRLEHRLTYPTSLRVNQADLSTLEVDRIPTDGIIAIAAAKGTGKTKLIGSAIKPVKTVLSAGHRIALMRNLCERLGLDYRGNLDRAGGRFINGAGYALRIGFCVDSLLAIDPKQFEGCDLVIDEVVQVLRHLLTSPTCNDQGMRPILLARFVELVRSARRVIVADADLDNATLHYLRQIRGDDSPAFLIRNDHQAAGYAVRFIESIDRSAITAMLLQDFARLEAGKVLFVATDSKGLSKKIARLLARDCPGKRILVINSDTSGGEAEREFIASPDAVLARGEYDGIIASPSLATGVSIEAQGVIDRVYGIFSGGSSTDADMAQSLIRVRERVDRVVWCAKRGSNFSKVSRSSNPIELKSHVQQQTSFAAKLVKLSLRDETQSVIAAYDWKGDPHLDLYAHFAAAQNRSMLSLRDALLVRLRHEGHDITIEAAASDAAAKLLLKTARDELKQIDAEAIANAERLTFAEVTVLQAKESQTPDEKLAIENFYLRDFYGLEVLTDGDVLNDREGRYRGELMNLEAQLYPSMAIDRTARALEKQASWNQSICPWDISNAATRQTIREKIGLQDFLKPDREWTAADIAPYAATARRLTLEIKTVLHLTIAPTMSDVQVVHQLLSQLGVKVAFRWSRSQPGFEGEKIRVYRLDADRWQQSIDILKRRLERREHQESSGSPDRFNFKNSTGDPTSPSPKTSEAWGTADSLADVRAWLDLAAAHPNDESIAQLLKAVPPDVLRWAIDSQT